MELLDPPFVLITRHTPPLRQSSLSLLDRPRDLSYPLLLFRAHSSVFKVAQGRSRCVRRYESVRDHHLTRISNYNIHSKAAPSKTSPATIFALDPTLLVSAPEPEDVGRTGCVPVGEGEVPLGVPRATLGSEQSRG